MTKFETDIENYYLAIDGHEFEIIEIEVKGKKRVVCETDISSISQVNLNIADFPDNLSIEIQDESGYDTYLFHKLLILKQKGHLYFDFECSQPNKFWEGRWGLATLLAALNDIVRDSTLANVSWLDLDNDWKELSIRFRVDTDFNFREKIAELAGIVNGFIKQTERSLTGVVWRKEYESDEKMFCTDILFPLLRKMGYTDVRFTHGNREYGKDFTFSEQTKFGNLRHFGLQAKAGNIRGNVNSDIDEIIGQLADAFGMSYHEVSANETRHISTFIIAISGQFTDNAKEKIIQKIPKHFLGSVYFIDRDKTMELIEKYWR